MCRVAVFSDRRNLPFHSFDTLGDTLQTADAD
jgi:hypothetical protein